MQYRLTAVLLVACLSPLAGAQNTVSYNCVLGEDTRRVEILYEPGVKVPCEVHYYKDTEAPGEKQVLWSAAHQEGFCEEQTQEFVSRLESWGWDCGDVSAAAVVPDSEGVTEDADSEPVAAEDDTDALAPAAPEPAEEDRR